MNDCLFCKLAHDPSVTIWENQTHSAFKDIHPKAKTHVLIVPKKHISTLDDIATTEDGGNFIRAVQEVAKLLNVTGAYRLNFNVGRHGGQEIDHLHAHLLSDRQA